VRFDWDSFLPHQFRIFVRPGITDMRKSIHALAFLVNQEMNLDLLQSAVFLFSNRKKDTIKILYWDGNGFCLWHKKLESAKFPFPHEEESRLELDRERFLWLLRGIDFRKEHKIINISRAI